MSIVQLWANHGTKILGTASTIVAGFVTIPNLIPHNHLPYWAAANIVLGALTVQRGYANSKRNEE